jgi:hypothetical protein
MSHTPGPWHAEGSVVTNDQDEIVSTCFIGFCARKDRDEDHATARLIAAAPDMLEALEEIMKTIAGCQTEFYYQLARAAIAKAKGEA